MVTRSIKPVLCVYRVTSDTYREPKGEFIMLYLSILSITCILRPPPATRRTYRGVWHNYMTRWYVHSHEYTVHYYVIDIH